MKGLETMRLTSRLLALALLVVIAAFTNLVSPVSKADDEFSPCLDGCYRGDGICRGNCGLNASCLQGCDATLSTCTGKCVVVRPYSGIEQ